MITTGNISVLIVDDDPITRLMHKEIVASLTQFNATSFEATNGLNALTQIIVGYSQYRTIPDIILLDCSMPEMDGFEFIRQLKGIYFTGNTRIIIVSVSDNESDKKKAKALGVEYFFTKPLTIPKLKTALIECIGEINENRNTFIYNRPAYLI